MIFVMVDIVIRLTWGKQERFPLQGNPHPLAGVGVGGTKWAGQDLFIEAEQEQRLCCGDVPNLIGIHGLIRRVDYGQWFLHAIKG